ncbi:MAG: phage portal protein, partial [Geminicoccaceae bacterium]
GSSKARSITPEQALQISVVMACVRILAESIAQLPIGIFTRNSNGDKEPRSDHPLYDLLQWQPNDEQTALEYREQLAAWLLLRGTAMSEIEPGARGAVGQLLPLFPDWTKAIKVFDLSGRSQWHVEYSEPGTPVRRIHRDNLFVVRSMMIDPECPILGLDPITAQAMTFSGAISAAEYGNNFFANDATPSGLITHPNQFKSPEDKNIFIRAWRKAFGGRRRGGTAILEYGMEYKQIGVTPEQAQFLDTQKHSDIKIARLFRVPPHKLGILDRATLRNIEHLQLEFVTESLMRWLIGVEQAVRRDLINDKSLFMEHNVAGLLRGDLKSRYESYMIGRQAGFITVNEIRKLENLPSIGPDGDTFLDPLNMAPTGSQDADPTQTTNGAARQEAVIDGQRVLLLDEDDEVVIHEH